ncbi:MAG: hypothetical protein AAFR81_10440 [Chloroflexota bacterium]
MNSNNNNTHLTSNRKPKKVRSMGYVAGVDEFLEDNRAFLSNRETDAPHMLAAYLRQQMRQRSWKPEDLAQKLEAPVSYVNLLLDARIPQSKIDRYLLHCIVETLDADQTFVFGLVGRQVYPEDNREQMIEAKHDLSEYILTEISNVLLTTIDGAYNASETSQPDMYDKVLKELHKIIARQRRDLRFVQMLINSLDNPELIQSISGNLDELADLTEIAAESGMDTQPQHKALPRKEIDFVKNRLQRIVRYFEDRVG